MESWGFFFCSCLSIVRLWPLTFQRSLWLFLWVSPLDWWWGQQWQDHHYVPLDFDMFLPTGFDPHSDLFSCCSIRSTILTLDKHLFHYHKQKYVYSSIIVDSYGGSAGRTAFICMGGKRKNEVVGWGGCQCRFGGSCVVLHCLVTVVCI